MTDYALKAVAEGTIVKTDKAALYPVAFFKRKDSFLGHIENLTWDQFCDKIRHTPLDDKEQAGLFAGALLKEDHHPYTGEIGNRRCKVHVERRSMVVLDIDCKDEHTVKAPQPIEVVNMLKRDWKGLWAFYTSHSHAPQNPRYRIIFPVDPGLDLPGDFLPGQYVAQRLGLDMWLDDGKLLGNSLFYLPSCPQRMMNLAMANASREGSPLGVDFFAEYLAIYQQQEADRQMQEQAAAAEAARQERIAKGGDGATLIEKARDLVPSVPELLAKHGYTLHGKKWLHPQNKSGIPGVSILKGRDGVTRAYSHNWTDPISQHRGGGHALDNLDLFCLFELGGKQEDLWRHLSGITPKTERFHSSHADMGLDDFEEAVKSERREQQRKENEAIGEQLPEVSILPQIHEVQQALDRFALLTHGSQVIDLHEPRRCYALPDFMNAFRASKFKEEVVGKDGKTKVKETPVTSIWLNHPERKTLEG